MGSFLLQVYVGMLYFTAHASHHLQGPLPEKTTYQPTGYRPSQVVDMENTRHAEGIVHIVIGERRPEH